MTHGMYTSVHPMGHGKFVLSIGSVHSMTHGEFIFHDTWSVHWCTPHDPWTQTLMYTPCVMGNLYFQQGVYTPWGMGNLYFACGVYTP